MRLLTGRRKISNLRYADDTTLLASSRDEMVTLLRRLGATALEFLAGVFGSAINRDNTKMIIVDRASSNQSDVRHIAGCELVKSYVYLGSLITDAGGCEDEIRRRFAAVCPARYIARSLAGDEVCALAAA
ncbi:hypothetical protein ACJJTC_014139 [Scirpophaga incertulas]